MAIIIWFTYDAGNFCLAISNMSRHYTWTLCSKVWEIQEIIKKNKWGYREQEISEIESLVWYIHQDWQSMEDKLYKRKDEVEELKNQIKSLEKDYEDRIKQLEQKNDELEYNLSNISFSL